MLIYVLGITPQTPPVTTATTMQSASTLSQSSSTLSQPLSMIGLPTYSDYVTANLRAGDSHLVWSKMICEAAHYYLANYPQMGMDNSSSEYRKVGQAMFKQFPTIARDGTQPWVRHLLTAIAYDGEILCKNNETHTKLIFQFFSHDDLSYFKKLL